MPTRPRAHHPPGARKPPKPYDGPRLYDSLKWRRASKAFLRANPLCAECENEDPPRFTPAVVTDHIKPHGGDFELFWDPANWQPLCVAHHNAKTMRETYQAGKQKKER